MPFKTTVANEAFKVKAVFTINATTALDGAAGTQNSSELYARLGKHWASAEAEMVRLTEADAQKPADDSKLKDNIAAEVELCAVFRTNSYAPSPHPHTSSTTHPAPSRPSAPWRFCR